MSCSIMWCTEAAGSPLYHPQRGVTAFLKELSDTHTQFLHQHSLLQTTPPSLPEALEASVMGREEDQQPGLSSGIHSRAALLRNELELAQEDSQTQNQGFKGFNSEKT